MTKNYAGCAQKHVILNNLTLGNFVDLAGSGVKSSDRLTETKKLSVVGNSKFVVCFYNKKNELNRLILIN